jgi:hypothetical protein
MFYRRVAKTIRKGKAEDRDSLHIPLHAASRRCPNAGRGNRSATLQPLENTANH